MITHAVLLRLLPGIDRHDERVEAAHAAMAQLPARVAQILSWQHGFNRTPDTQAWDYCLIAGFASEADLLAYFDHPEHVKVAEQWQLIADLAFVDLE